MRNQTAKLIALIPSALLALDIVVPTSGESSGERPNSVLFYTDDQSYHALGLVEPYFHTPHTDRFAAEEIVFHNAFVTTAVCAVSRASLLTGQHIKRHGIDSFDRPLSKEQMEKSFPGLLRDAGCRTAFLGKFAIGQSRSVPQEVDLRAVATSMRLRCNELSPGMLSYI
jgi:arylsulfatase A-like enzyme